MISFVLFFFYGCIYARCLEFIKTISFIWKFFMQMSVKKSRKNSAEKKKKNILLNEVEQKLLRRRIGILDKMQ